MDKKFVKVVEWDKEPNGGYIVSGITLIVIGFLSCVFSMFKDDPSGFVFFLSGVGCFISGLWILIENVGEGRRVIFKEVRE